MLHGSYVGVYRVDEEKEKKKDGLCSIFKGRTNPFKSDSVFFSNEELLV